jgi:(E)-4-hydroxy-3-methylbut-2-enyl-diphosphate synthase
MNRYGDTPFGMVESALEFARICRKNDYHNFLFSMKASNPQVMIQAYRLLTQAMYELRWDYPLHLGVTEAGEGEDGRIKSAMGIGSLLLDGIGDTIRVSLTEDPWYEIDPCRRLIKLASTYQNQGIEIFEEKYRNIEAISRRKVQLTSHIPMHRDGTVFISLPLEKLKEPSVYQELGCEGSFGKPKLKTATADNLVINTIRSDVESRNILQVLKDLGIGIFSKETFDMALSIHSLKEWNGANSRFSDQLTRRNVSQLIQISDESEKEWENLFSIQPQLIILSPTSNRLHYSRQFFEWLQANQLNCPVVLNFTYQGEKEDTILLASMECGSLLCDGLGDGIWLEGPFDVYFLRQLSFSILQAARMRMSKTDFIS